MDIHDKIEIPIILICLDIFLLGICFGYYIASL
jgi:hypothetical protein